MPSVYRRTFERKEKEAEQKRQQKEKHEQEKRNKALREAALKALKKKRKQDTPVQSQDVQDTPEKSDKQSGSQVSLRVFYIRHLISLSAIFTRSSMRNASRATSQI